VANKYLIEIMSTLTVEDLAANIDDIIASLGEDKMYFLYCKQFLVLIGMLLNPPRMN